MASNPTYTPILQRIDWLSKNLEEEYDQFVEMVELMWVGPLSKTTPEEKFGYVKLWSVPKSLTLWRNSGKTGNKVEDLLVVLKNYCIPSDRRFWSARMEFRQLSQRQNEPIQDFSSRVISLAKTCAWSNVDEQVVYAIIFGSLHRDAQRKALLCDKTFAVRDCIAHFASYEATDTYHKAIVNHGHSSVNFVSRNCYNCGQKHSKGHCKAFGHVCRSCGKSHHFESVCMSKSKNNSTSRQPASYNSNKHYKQSYGTYSANKQSSYKHSHKRGGIRENIKFVNDEQSEQSDDNLFFANAIHDIDSNDTCVKLTFKGAKREITASIDTGAAISVLPVRVYKLVFPHIPIQPTNIKLSAYNNTPIDVRGKINVSCNSGNVCKPLSFVVITSEHTRTIIGKNDAINLKCIRFLGTDSDPRIVYAYHLAITPVIRRRT